MMNQTPSIFNFKNAAIRVVTLDGEPWFVAKDVADILGYRDTAQAGRTHCKGVVEITTPSSGGSQQTKVIPERDVYRLILRSKKPEAEAFEEWVVGEVLPSIRKTGKYTHTPTSEYTPESVHLLTAAVEAADAIAKSFRMCESSKLDLTKRIVSDTTPTMLTYLPKYAIDAPSSTSQVSAFVCHSLTHLLKEQGLTGSASIWNKRLEASGVLEQQFRKSSKGLDKPYWSITDKGLEFGKNVVNDKAKNQTQPHWYDSKFLDLINSIQKKAA